jgi:hypothetical protein
MLKEYAESVKAFEARAILPLTEEEIEEEGQEQPKRKVYSYDETEAGHRLKEHHARIFNAQERLIRERHPEWSEHEVNAKCQEYQEYIIYQETKPKWSSALGKIWEKKKKKDEKFY